jgi:hypothetical protein
MRAPAIGFWFGNVSCARAESAIPASIPARQSRKVMNVSFGTDRILTHSASKESGVFRGWQVQF